MTHAYKLKPLEWSGVNNADYFIQTAYVFHGSYIIERDAGIYIAKFMPYSLEGDNERISLSEDLMDCLACCSDHFEKYMLDNYLELF